MIKYVKLIEILESLNEAESTTHSNKRITDRISSFRNFKIYNDDTFIGTANFTKSNLDEINNNLDKIRNTEFIKGKSYGIIVSKLELNKKNVEFEKGFSVKDINPDTYLINSLTGNKGEKLYAVVRDNEIVTIMWLRTKKYPNMTKYLEVDEMISYI